MINRMMLIGCFCALSLAGCGDGGPKLVPVSGTVTMNGKPLEGATVAFSPDASNKEGQGADDLTGPSGNYKAMTRGRSGVVPGKYKVVVTKTPTAASSNASDAFKDDPFMANLKVEVPTKGKKDTAKIEGIFDRDVPSEGGTIDFDVKATAEAASKDAAPK